ncbi:hypothetical protein F5B21DRAFT_521801 [Xylaria acuta]|nr:hypothetical protein F5B21DRAFT_521801 [Xylaria acuta]
MGLQIVTIAAYALILHLLLPNVLGQQLATVKCVTLAGGCDAGGAYTGALQKAINQFYINMTYGGSGGETIVYSASQDGGALAQVSYSCKSGSRPPSMGGYDVRQRLQLVGDCDNSCGSISVNSDCGFGVLMVEEDANPSQSCWSKGLQVTPKGSGIVNIPSDKGLLKIVQLLRSEFDAIRNLAEYWLTILENDDNVNEATDTRFFNIKASTSRDSIYAEVRRRTRTNVHNTQNTVEAFEMYSLRGSRTSEESLPYLRNLEGAQEQLLDRLGTTSSTNLAEGAAGAFASALGFLAAAVGGGGGGGDPDPGDGQGGGNDNGNGQGNGGILEIPPVCIPCVNTIITQVVASLRPVLDTETLDLGLDAPLTTRNILQARWENRRQYDNSFIPQNMNAPQIDVCLNNEVTQWRSEEYPSTTQWPNSDNDPESAPNLAGIGLISTLPGSGPYNGPSVSYYAAYDSDTPFCVPHLTRSLGVRNNVWSVFETDPPPAMGYATEHVFELHIVKDFIIWLTKNRGIPCHTISVANLLGTQNGDVSFIDQMMRELSWYKSYAGGLEYPCRERLSEFFVLESHLNQYKTQIMNGRPLDESEANNPVLPRPTSLGQCDEYLEMLGMTTDYLNASPVALAFMYARKRIYDYLTRVHTQQYISNINLNGAFVNELWVQFTDAWVIKRNNDLQAWRDDMEQTCLMAALGDQCRYSFYQNRFASPNGWGPARFRLPADWLVQDSWKTNPDYSENTCP